MNSSHSSRILENFAELERHFKHNLNLLKIRDSEIEGKKIFHTTYFIKVIFQ